VKATDELCRRTYAVHTLKSHPTKIPKFPDGGGGKSSQRGALAPKAPPPVAPPLDLDLLPLVLCHQLATYTVSV